MSKNTALKYGFRKRYRFGRPSPQRQGVRIGLPNLCPQGAAQAVLENKITLICAQIDFGNGNRF